MNAIHHEEYKGYVINIIPDDSGCSGRAEKDNIEKLILFHRRYRIGDKHVYRHEDYTSWDCMEAAIAKNEDAVVIERVFMYDHSGLRFKIGSFAGLLPQGHAEFDSGMVGFVVVPRKALLEAFGAKRTTPALKAQAQKIADAAVKQYDDEVAGNIYGYEIRPAGIEDADVEDSCWGYIGDYDGEYGALSAARSSSTQRWSAICPCRVSWAWIRGKTSDRSLPR